MLLFHSIYLSVYCALLCYTYNALTAAIDRRLVGAYLCLGRLIRLRTSTVTCVVLQWSEGRPPGAAREGGLSWVLGCQDIQRSFLLVFFVVSVHVLCVRALFTCFSLSAYRLKLVMLPMLQGNTVSTSCRFAPGWARASRRKRACCSSRDEAIGIWT